MLSQKYTLADIRAALVSAADWRPWPTAADRDAWAALPVSVRGTLLERGERHLGFDWPSITARMVSGFLRHGDRKTPENRRSIRRGALRDLVLAECIEHEGRFLDDIANGIWVTCEEIYWGNLGGLHNQKAGHDFPDPNERVVELFTAETAAQLTLYDYLLGERLDTVSPQLRKRMRHEVQVRMLDILDARDDFGYLGFTGSRVNNWNPWINSNWLICALHYDEDPDHRAETVYKSMRSVDNFIDPYPADGGCDEGPGYWGKAGASVFDCLELLRGATSGAVDVYDQPLIRNMGAFIYRAHICDSWFVNFADANARVTPSASLLVQFGKRIGDDDMVALGAWFAARDNVAERGPSDSIQRLLPALFNLDIFEGIEPRQPFVRDAWLPVIQVLTTRDVQGTSDGFFLAAKGGHNAESHNHNDIGNFVVFRDGKPLLVDGGVGTYTKATFGPNRYDIWTMQSAHHTFLPTVDGVQQHVGGEFAARDVAAVVEDTSAALSLDIAGAYPAEAAIETWKRTITLERGKAVTVLDDYAFTRQPEEVTFAALTPCAARVEGNRIVLEERSFGPDLLSGSGTLCFDADQLTVRQEPLPVGDARLEGVWGESLTRLLFTLKPTSLTGSLTYTIAP